MSAVIPPTFQDCSRDGSRPGCLIKFDSPSEQCANGRKGLPNFNLLSFQRNCCISVLYNIGFLCGQCPKGEGVDFTLRQCKKCTIQDAIFVTAFCKINTCVLKQTDHYEYTTLYLI